MYVSLCESHFKLYKTISILFLCIYNVIFAKSKFCYTRAKIAPISLKLDGGAAAAHKLSADFVKQSITRGVALRKTQCGK